MTKPDIGLGDEVKDKVTGFVGIVIGQSQWLNGCDRLVVQSQKLKDGKSLEPEHMDINQAVLLKKGKVKAVPRDNPPGGPLNTPAKAHSTNPKRF